MTRSPRLPYVPPVPDSDLDRLGLPERHVNALRRLGLHTVEQVLDAHLESPGAGGPDLAGLRRAGPEVLPDVLAALAGAGMPHPAANGRVQGRAEELMADGEWMRKRYEADGLTVSELAAEVGATPHSVRRAMRQHDIPTRRAGRLPGLTVPELNDAQWLDAQARAGRTMRQIADVLGVSAQSVSAAMLRLGVEPSDRSKAAAGRLRDRRQRAQEQRAQEREQRAG